MTCIPTRAIWKRTIPRNWARAQWESEGKNDQYPPNQNQWWIKREKNFLIIYTVNWIFLHSRRIFRIKFIFFHNSLVSKKKKRFTNDKYDLDLACNKISVPISFSTRYKSHIFIYFHLWRFVRLDITDRVIAMVTSIKSIPSIITI